MVVLYHSCGCLSALVSLPHVGKPVKFILENISPLGTLGVELFFVLSGFLIGNILIKTFMSAKGFSFASVRNFWIRRWFRTLPNYWLILTINILLYRALELTRIDSGKLLFYPFLQNLWLPHPLYFFGEAWSLSVEEWFYLTLPLTILLSWVIFRPENKKVFLIRVFTCYLLTFALIRFLNAFHPLNGPDQDIGIRKVVLFRLDAVMYGVMFACFNYFRPEVLRRIKNYLFIIGLGGSIALYYAIASPSIAITNPADPHIKFLSDAFLYLLIPLFFSMLLPYFNNLYTLGNKYINGTIMHISKISYSMYLIHFSLLYVPFFYFHPYLPASWSVMAFVIYWVLVIALSTIIYRCFELPVMKLRDKYSDKSEGEVS